MKLLLKLYRIMGFSTDCKLLLVPVVTTGIVFPVLMGESTGTKWARG